MLDLSVAQGNLMRLGLKAEYRRPEFDALYEGQCDEFGFDLKTLYRWEPFFRFLFEEYFQVQVIGLENVPSQGRAILVSNHSGGLPIDAFMTFCAIHRLHPSPRRIRCLALQCLLDVPILKDVIRGMGGVPAKFEIARDLLEHDELVLFYPEGPRGTGKPFSMRYRLLDFDPGFIKAAITTRTPIIPVTVIGADEIYPLLAKSSNLARLLHMPYYPITPGFPWLPIPASCVPLPIRFLIKFGKPIGLDWLTDEQKDRKSRLHLARQVQFEIQRELNLLLRQRRSPFAGWDIDALKLPQPDWKIFLPPERA